MNLLHTIIKKKILGSKLNQIKALIMSLEPVFWIKDMTDVQGGYLVDSSGNNKQIAVSSVSMENDTITMPASDTDIIAALRADGTYNQFYTDDLTPKAVRIGEIRMTGARRMYSKYNRLNFCLFSAKPATVDEEKLYNLLAINLAWLPDVNIAHYLNLDIPSNPNNPLTASTFAPLLQETTSCIRGDNAFSFSESKKTLTGSITAPTTINYTLAYYQYSVGGNYKVSFWINREQMGDRRVVIYTYLNSTHLLGQPTKATCATLNSTWTYTVDGQTFTGKIAEISGDWTRIEMSGFVYNNGLVNEWRTMSYQIGLGYGTAIEQTFDHVDIVFTKDYAGNIGSGNWLAAPSEKNNSAIVGKTLCAVGDSITQGGFYLKNLQYTYGLQSIINTGKSGTRMANNSTIDMWIPNYQSTVATQAADIWVILASANDNGSVIGTIDSTDDTTYLGAYNNYLTYLLANITDVANKKIVLCTQPIIVGTGNTIAEGKAAFETQFQNMADGVKALGVKYSLPVCDLHSLSPLTFENSPIYLGDKVHWTNVMDVAVGDILGKFINDLF